MSSRKPSSGSLGSFQRFVLIGIADLHSSRITSQLAVLYVLLILIVILIPIASVFRQRHASPRPRKLSLHREVAAMWPGRALAATISHATNVHWACHSFRGIAMKFRSYRAHFLTLIAVVAMLSLAGAFDAVEPPPGAIESPEIARELAVAAQRFIDALDPGMQALYLFRDAERGNFHFFPIARRGVPLKALKDGQRHLGLALMNATLSHVGVQKALTIMSLGDYLRATDKTPNIHRDSDQ